MIKDIKIIKSNRKYQHQKIILEYTKALYIFGIKNFNDNVDWRYRFKKKFYMCPKDKDAYIILYKNKPIGIFSIVKYYGFNYIWRWYIRQDYRGQGIGREVFDHIINKMFPNKSINLLVDTKNERMIKFYENRGFKNIGLEEYPNGNNEYSMFLDRTKEE